MRRLLLITLLAALAPCVNGQRMGAASPHFAARFNRGGGRHASFYPLVYSDPFYADYLSSTGDPAASQPPMIILQSPPASAPEPGPTSPPLQPLMIELQGDRYVRVSGPETSGAEMIDRMPERESSALIHAVAAPELPPAILVFRDGHREEASEYTIADGVLYTRSDYYTTGSWNRKIQLSSLDLPETFKSNQSRGVKFQLPSSPNEIIVRP
ncbi:MAG TPA: hypothetical protein VIX37_24155 [Candidatus Sulfotelmatobacter sp.]